MPFILTDYIPPPPPQFRMVDRFYSSGIADPSVYFRAIVAHPLTHRILLFSDYSGSESDLIEVFITYAFAILPQKLIFPFRLGNEYVLDGFFVLTVVF